MDSNELMKEKLGLVSDSVAELKEYMRQIERRIRDMETDEVDQMRKAIYRLENQMANFRDSHDSNKERWKMALNFMVQLIWVVMASYVLTKLGLGMGPV